MPLRVDSSDSYQSSSSDEARAPRHALLPHSQDHSSLCQHGMQCGSARCPATACTEPRDGVRDRKARVRRCTSASASASGSRGGTSVPSVGLVIRSGTPPTRSRDDATAARERFEHDVRRAFGMARQHQHVGTRPSTSGCARAAGRRRGVTRSPSGRQRLELAFAAGRRRRRRASHRARRATTVAHAVAEIEHALLGLEVADVERERARRAARARARAAARSRGWNSSPSTPFITIATRSRAHAERDDLVGERATDGDDARGSRQRPRRHPARPGCFAIRLMSEPCSLTTAGTPSRRAAITAAKPSGYAHEPSTTSTLPR